MKRRFKPKEWPRPRSKRTRWAHDPMPSDLAKSSAMILKHLYTPGKCRPWWATLAYDRGWMTLAAYLRAKLVETKPPLEPWYTAFPKLTLRPKRDPNVTRGSR